MQGKRHDRVVEMWLCFFSGKVDDYKVQFESTRKCRSTLRGAGMKRAKTLVSAAEHSVGSKEASEAARIELRNLLNDMDVYASRLEELL